MSHSLLTSCLCLTSMIGTTKTKHFWHFTCFLDFYMRMFNQFRLEICGGNCPTIPAYMFLLLPLSQLQAEEDTRIFWSLSGGPAWSPVCSFCTKLAVGIDLIMRLNFLFLTFTSAAWGGRQLHCLCLRTGRPCDSSWSTKHNRQVNLQKPKPLVSMSSLIPPCLT